MKYLAKALLKEQARVKELIPLYRDPLLAGTGDFTATIMEVVLREADHALKSKNLAMIFVAYKNLMEFH